MASPVNASSPLQGHRIKPPNDCNECPTAARDDVVEAHEDEESQEKDPQESSTDSAIEQERDQSGTEKPQRTPSFKATHRLLVAMLTTSVYLLLLFLCALSYFYGSLFNDVQKAHNLEVLAVNYDGGEIGQALQEAYGSLEGPQYLTLHFQSPNDYPDPSSLRRAMCRHGYWAIIYTHLGASERLFSAVSGNATAPYDPKNTITYQYHGIRYPVIAEAYILAQLSELVATTTGSLFAANGAKLLSEADFRNPMAARALFDPIRASAIDLSPANQGARVLLNTVTMIAPPLMQFFFLMALDHTSTAIGIYARHSKQTIYTSRLLGSTIFTFFSGLVISGVIYAFRESWPLSPSQFAETWMCFWFYSNICYVVMDSVVGTVVPLRWVSFFIFAFVIVNITSTLFPFQLSPDFYHWGYALPGHNVWLLLIEIWTSGCISKLDVALPVLFAWWVVGHATSMLAVIRKCRAGSKRKE